MPDAVFARDGTTVSVPLLGDASESLRSRTVGKPQATEYDIGSADPRVEDNLSANDNFNLVGILTGSSAYADAKTLAEDIAKPRPDGATPKTVDLSSLSNHSSSYEVAFLTEGALELTYVPGERDMVGVEVNVTVVDETAGGTQSSASTSSPESGNGVTLRRDGSTAVTLTSGVEVTRSVGRPNADPTPRPGTLPRLTSTNSPAADTFEIRGVLTGAFATSDAKMLEEDIVRAPLGDDALTLSFNDGLYGLDAYPVHPAGSAAVRTVYLGATKNEVRVPLLRLQVVSN